MSAPYLNAEPHGIGELIQLKKRFHVPEHQRDYSWTEEEVATFIDDILSAIRRNVGDYFVGLIVLIGPRSGAWEILDGQQRLATTTMLFSAIRQWLDAAGFDEDARQVEEEFIALRQLGQEQAPRLMMNVNDRDAFTRIVLQKTHLQQVQLFADSFGSHTSQKLLASAATFCRTAVDSWATEGGKTKDGQVAQIYRLAQFLEGGVKVVCLELDSEADAYMIFESLNFRGQDLSVLDLVKNHLYSLATDHDREMVSREWGLMRSNIAEKDADDFLKVFWTSRFGRVQRGDLFRLIKEKYSTSTRSRELSSSLLSASIPYVATDDPLHEIWSDFPQSCADHIFALTTLRTKQVRPIILSALEIKFTGTDLEQLLWILVVLTVRYQTVGKRRTGVLESACARLAADIYNSQVRTAADVAKSIRAILPSDDEFRTDFLTYSESNGKRAFYILAALETCLRYNSFGYDSAEVRALLSSLAETTAAHVLPKEAVDDWLSTTDSDPEFFIEAVDFISNWVLLESYLCKRIVKSDFTQMAKVIAESRFNLTRAVGTQFHHWDRSSILTRQNQLADLAVLTWKFSV